MNNYSNNISAKGNKSTLKKLNLTPLALAISITGACLLALPLTINTAYAQEQPDQIKSYNISAGNLNTVLTNFSAISGTFVAGSAEMAAGKTSAGVQGSYSTAKALQQILQGTGLKADQQDSGSYTLSVAPIAESDNDVKTLDTMRVIGETVGEDAAKELGTSFLFNKTDLDIIQPRDLKDIFSGESNVSVGGSVPMNQKLYLQGIEETALSVTIDGARQNNKVFHHSATTLIDPALLKSVRASAGISPADYGPGAIGGSIVFETVDVADVLAKDKMFGGFLKAGYDIDSQTITTGVSLYGQQQGFEFLGFINNADGDDYTDGDGNTVEHTEAALFSGLAKVAYEAKSGDRFEFSYESVNDDATRPYRANFAGLTAGRPTPESRTYDLTRDNIVFNYSNQKDFGLWNPNVVLAKSETEVETTEVPLSDPNRSIVYTGITDSRSGKIENLFLMGFAKINAGMDFYKDSTRFKYVGDPDLVEKVKNIGTFIQVRQEFNMGLNLSYGLRYDDQKFTGADDSKQSTSGFSKNIFAEYAPSKYIKFKAGYADVWGGIGLAENFIINGAWDYSQGIKAVEANNYIVGVETKFNGFKFGVNRYKTDITNGRTPSYRGGPGVVSDFEIDGYDIFAGYQNGKDKINIKYSNIKSEKNDVIASSYDGNYFTTALGKSIAIQGLKVFENYNTVLGVTVEIALDNDAIENQGQKQQGYSVFNTFVEHETMNNFNLRLEINNLFDEAYVDRASYGQEFVTVNPLLEQGRSFLISARYTF